MQSDERRAQCRARLRSHVDEMLRLFGPAWSLDPWWEQGPDNFKIQGPLVGFHDARMGVYVTGRFASGRPDARYRIEVSGAWPHVQVPGMSLHFRWESARRSDGVVRPRPTWSAERSTLDIVTDMKRRFWPDYKKAYRWCLGQLRDDERRIREAHELHEKLNEVYPGCSWRIGGGFDDKLSAHSEYCCEIGSLELTWCYSPSPHTRTAWYPSPELLIMFARWCCEQGYGVHDVRRRRRKALVARLQQERRWSEAAESDAA